MIPAALMNASLTVYLEKHGTGASGEPKQTLAVIANVRGRGELKSIPRQSGDYMQTPHTVSVWLNGGMELTPRHWVKVVADTGQELIGQVATTSQPGLMAHHIKVTIEVRKPTVPLETTP